MAKKGKARGPDVRPAKKGKSGGSAMGKLLLAALVVGGGLFAGIRYTDRAQALVNGVPMHHVVDLVSPEEVRRASERKPAPRAHRHAPRRSTPSDDDSD